MFTKPMLAASGAASLLLCSLGGPALSQTPPSGNGVTALPEIDVDRAEASSRETETEGETARDCPARRVPADSVVQPSPAPVSPAEQLAAKGSSFDQARSNIFTTIGTTSDTISHDTIQDLPQGTNQPVEKVLLQAPGVSQDSAASGSLHVRNDHANVQYRINGVLLPDGVTGFGSIFDTSFIGSMSLVTGALPAEFGLRTVGLVDITTRTDLFNNSGTVSMYGGSHGTITPSIEYGGTFGSTCPATTTTSPAYVKAPPASADCFAGVQYYFTGRYLQNTVGLENPTPAYNAIHDFSQQEQGLRLHVRVRRPDHPGQPDRRHLEQQLSDSQYSRSTDRTERGAGHQRIRHHQFQFGAAQRKSVGDPLSLACCRCRNPTRASTGNCPISPATTICTSCRTRPAISC